MFLSVYIGIPSLDGKISVRTMDSLIKTLTILNKEKIKCMYSVFQSSHINRSRNVIVSDFLNSGYSHLLFLDTDIYNFENVIMKLIEAKKDIIGACYPIKELHKLVIKKEDIYNNFESCSKFNVNLINYPAEILNSKKSIIEVENIGTGLMLINRSIFMKLIKKYPERKYKNNLNENANEQYLYNFFDSFIDPEKKVYLTEDYGFCYLVRKIGNKIYAEIETTISHIGNFEFKGNLKDYLKK